MPSSTPHTHDNKAVEVQETLSVNDTRRPAPCLRAGAAPAAAKEWVKASSLPVSVPLRMLEAQCKVRVHDAIPIYQRMYQQMYHLVDISPCQKAYGHIIFEGLK